MLFDALSSDVHVVRRRLLLLLPLLCGLLPSSPATPSYRWTHFGELDWSHKKIRSLPQWTTFDWANQVQMLSLTSNQISTITDGAFAGLESLSTLVLDGNPIRNIGHRAFFGLRLLTLSLNGIGIHTIDGSIFQNLSSMILFLQDNEIEVVTSLMFAGRLPALRRLVLTRNRIHTIGPGAFSGLDKLEDLCLTGNPICEQLNDPTNSWMWRAAWGLVDTATIECD
ncbi:Leucine-rich repeat-containing N-terminal plant-type domain-containing protein [Plasmodiophora brassicae]